VGDFGRSDGFQASCRYVKRRARAPTANRCLWGGTEPIRSGGNTAISGRAKNGMMSTVAVSESLIVMPGVVMGRFGDRITLMGGDEVEA